LIVADHYHLAGSLRLHLPGRLFWGPREDFVLPEVGVLAAGRSVVLVWDASRQTGVPGHLAALVAGAGLALDGVTPEVITAPYRYGVQGAYRLGIAVLGR
jgi:hypothetical protein